MLLKPESFDFEHWCADRIPFLPSAEQMIEIQKAKRHFLNGRRIAIVKRSVPGTTKFLLEMLVDLPEKK